MAQQFNFENTTQQTVAFSVVENGDMFIFANEPYIKLDNNNPNAAKEVPNASTAIIWTIIN